jgi:8-oxo-dGTP pyrophosphatase MutT (NUDIX family)
MYFLLAKERFHASWPKGSNLWTDFGGRYQQGDQSAEETAAREFLEETLGQVKYFEEDVLPLVDYQKIAASLKEEERYLLLFKHGTRSTFVVQLPWDPLVPRRFVETLLCPEAAEWEACYLEKSTLGLFSVPQVQQATLNKGYLSETERCHVNLTKSLSVIVNELQFHFSNHFF